MSMSLPVKRTRRHEWRQQAIVSGFVATAVAAVVLVGGYVAAQGMSQTYTHGTANTLVQWFYNLTHNRATNAAKDSLYGALLLHIVFGLLWAGVYAYYAEAALTGPGWRKGLIFSLGPWLLSVVVLLPLLGGGFLGFGLGAGPLPIIGNFVVHAVYGMVLGAIYGLSASQGANANGLALTTNNTAERGAAFGIAGGAVVGGLAGLGLNLFVGAANDVITGPLQLFLFGAALGAVGGALVGSMSGLTDAGKSGE